MCFSDKCHDNIRFDFPNLLRQGYPCAYGYKGGDQDREPYGPPDMHNDSVSVIYVTREAWVYDTGGSDGNFPQPGEFWTYEGDGFGTELVVNIDRAKNFS